MTIPADASGIPSVAPTATPPDDYQKIPTTSGMFGAQVGAGEEALGAGALKAGQFYDKAASEEAYTNYQRGVTNLLYGDPAKTGPDGNPDPGFMGLHGDAAMKARPGVQQQIESLRKEAMSGLITGSSQQDFDTSSRRLQSITYGQMGSHYEQQANKWGESVQRGAMVESQRNAALNYNDDEILKHNLADQDVLAQRASEHAGTSAAAEAAEARSKVVGAAIDGAIGQGDNARAQHIFATFGTQLDPARQAAVATHLRAQTAAAAGNDLLRRAQSDDQGTAPGTPPALGGAVAQRISQEAEQQGVGNSLALTTAHIESAMGQNLGSRGNIFQLGVPEKSSVGGMGADVDSQVRGGVTFLAQKQQELKAALGRDPTDAEVYLAHQQGTGGAVSLLNAAPGTPAGKVVPPANISSNGGDPNAPASDFVAKWRNKFQATAAAYGTAPPADQVGAKGFDRAAGDSIAVQQINHGVAGTAADFKTGADLPGTARVGAPPSEVVRRINDEVAADPKAFAGVNFLSTGASNDPSQVGLVGDQITAMRKGGATAIVIPGVGPGVKNATQVNAELSNIAQAEGAVFFQPQVKWQPDGVHPAEVDKVRDQGLAALRAASPVAAPTAPAAAPGTPAASLPPPDQLRGQPAPPAAVRPAMPPGAPAPGVTDIAAAQSALAVGHARTLANLSRIGASNPEAMAFAERRADLEYHSKELALAGQMRALTEGRNAAMTGYIKRMLPGQPINPGIMQEIANDPQLDGPSLENLRNAYLAQTRNNPEGDVTKLGSKFFEQHALITAPVGTPGKIRDPSQLYPLIQPKPDGTQDLTIAGLGTLTALLAKQKERGPGDELMTKRVDQFVQSFAPQIDKTPFMPMGFDQTGKERLYEFKYDLEEKMDQYRRDGKNPGDLLDPHKPDYMGSPAALKPYTRTMAEALSRLDTAGVTTGTDAAIDTKTKAGILAAYGANKMTREQAAKALIDGGFAAAPAAPRPDLSVAH